jgi:hypothetical protein
MRINELIVENQQIDELSLAGALGSAAKGAANIVGGAKGAWAGAKDVYNQQSGRVANVTQRNVQRAGGYKKPAASPATQSTSAPASLPQTGQGAGASADPASLRQQADALNQQADQLEKAAAQPAPASTSRTAPTATQPAVKGNPNNPDDLGFGFDGNTGLPFKSQAERDAGLAKEKAAASTAAPADQSLDLDQLKQQNAAKQAAGQADQQQAQQQMKATADANAATNQQDAAIKAAADAAKAKPAFQQTASDKLAIKQAADRGIREAKEKKKKLKKKKIVAEFHSNFLGIDL